MNFLFSKKNWQIILLSLLSVSGTVVAQNTSSTFSFTYWDSLYTDAINHYPDSIDSVIKHLLHEVEITNNFHGESYSKLVLANEFFRVAAWEKASEYSKLALSQCADLQGDPVDDGCKKIIERIYFLDAQIHQAQGNSHQAIFQYKRVAKLSRDNIDEYSLLAQIGLGEIHLSQGEYLRAYEHFGLARQMVIDHKIGNKLSARVLQESAELMSEVGLDSLSEKNLDAALQIANEYADTILIIKTLNARGRNHLQAERLNQAETVFSEAQNLSNLKNALDLNAEAQLGLGKIAYRRGDIENSLFRFEKVSHLSKLLNKSETLAESHTYIGKINLEYGLIDSALVYCNSAYNTASIANLLRIQLQSCNCLKQIHQQRNEWQNAFELQQEEIAIKAQMNENQLLHKINSVRFEQSLANLKDQQTRERQQLESEKSWTDQLLALQSSRVFLLSILFGITLLLAFILYHLFRAKKLHNIELQSLNQQLNGGNQLLEESNTELNTTNETLQQTNKALNNFAAVAAHDLKGPLRTINSFTQLLKRRLGDKVGQNEEEYFQYINGSSAKLSTLIDDLLNFSRLGKQMKAPTEVDLDMVFKDVKTNLHQSITHTNAILISDQLPTVMANTSLMTQLFQNIISNSLKFAQKDKPAQINLNCSTLEASRVQISIQDNGIGIPEEEHQQVFELFTRLDSKKKYEGSGVGLATCQKIVQHYGGKIKINSQENIGTTVIFDLPLADAS